MAEPLVLVEKDKGIALVTLNNPEKLNILNLPMLEALDQTFEALASDEAVRVVILTGKGKAFVAGADIKHMSGLDAVGGVQFARNGQRVFEKIENLPKPVIAAINGYALGGGMELAMACDLRIASEKAVLGQPEVHLGLIPGFAGTQRLTRLVGYGWAKRLILTGERISAQKAYEIGLVEEVVPPEELLDRARAVAREIMKGSPEAVAFAKEVINRGRSTNFEAACAYEANAFGLLFATGEPQEGLKAFLEKRKPSWYPED